MCLAELFLRLYIMGKQKYILSCLFSFYHYLILNKYISRVKYTPFIFTISLENEKRAPEQMIAALTPFFAVISVLLNEHLI